MKIASAQLQMASAHASQQEHSIRESMRMWVGQQRPDFAAGNPRNSPDRNPVTISDAGKAAQSADDIKKNIDDAVNKDPELNLIRDMLEFITGDKIKLFDSAELEAHFEQTHVQSAEVAAATSQTQASSGYGLEYDYHESYTETEQTSFSASGTVKTTDGREISFNIQLSMTRSYHEESNVSLRLGDAVRKTDPLVMNFGGTAAQLTDRRFAFDLNSDGNAENINFVGQGSGFLVFDRNQDGKVNNGRELFGPSSGNGFAELSQLDDDKNGWIDANDQKFNALKIWSKTEEGADQVKSLGEAGVGAISLAQIDTPFLIKNNDNQLLGAIRNSGIFLQEAGDTGTIQQIDLTA